MHIGQVSEVIPLWRERWRDSPLGRGGHMESYRAGNTTRTLESYQCEHCGRVANVLGVATEPFFCDCNWLIGIEPATTLVSGESQ